MTLEFEEDDEDFEEYICDCDYCNGTWDQEEEDEDDI